VLGSLFKLENFLPRILCVIRQQPLLYDSDWQGAPGDAVQSVTVVYDGRALLRQGTRDTTWQAVPFQTLTHAHKYSCMFS